MAELKQVPFGKPSGKFGDIIFRIMNGKKFFSRRAKKYKRTKSIKLKEARFNFGTVVNFAKITNSVPELKEAWKESKVKGSNAYHKIIKANSGLVKTGTLTIQNIISPPGSGLKLLSIAEEAGSLEVTISFSSVKTGMPATLCMVFYFDRDKIFAQTEMIETPAEDDIYSLSFPLKSEIKKVLKKNSKPVLFLAVAGVPVRRNIFWTDTIVKQF